MSLGREDATRVLRFCLAGDGWGSAVEEDGVCVVRVARTGGGDPDLRRFEGQTFEEALRQAVAMGVLRGACIEKQIAFLARTLPERSGGGGPGQGRDDLDAAAELGAGGSASSPSMWGGAINATLFPVVARALGGLLHDTQRERGRSALYTGSGGRLSAGELRDQWRATDERRMELASLRRRYSGRLPGSLTATLDTADETLTAAVAIRRRVEALEIELNDVIEVYTRFNRALLIACDTLATDGVETALRPVALAWMALLHAKEKTGIVRAQLAGAFALDRFMDADSQHLVVSGLIAARRSYLHLFAAAAPRDAARLLEQSLASSEVVRAVEEMEKVALSRSDGFGIDPVDWFATATRSMDLLDEVDVAVMASLESAAVAAATRSA
jgi:hypothetical protein